MKILQVNKFYFPKGGADKYFLDLSLALEKSGHQVAVFSMQDKHNLPSPFSGYFASNFDFNNLSLKQKIQTPKRIIYSHSVKRKFKKLIKDFQPDIIHIHNIYHQLSPSILEVAKSYKIPVVMHLHDYKLICPNYQLFAHGRPCEDCLPDKYFNCTKKKCFKNSFSKSLLASLEMFIHHKILKIYKKNIHTFIAPSQFMKNKVVQVGWPANQIKVIVNPYPTEDALIANKNSQGNYFLFFGRLSKEKGVDLIVKAAQINNWSLKIVGQGPEEEYLKSLADKNDLINFLGFKSGKELRDIILQAKAIILPSISYDNMPLSLLEAMNLGKVVIASKIGGIPEIINHGENGFLFEANNLTSLEEVVLNLKNYSLEKISQAAKKSVSQYSLNDNVEAVVNVYRKILEK